KLSTYFRTTHYSLVSPKSDFAVGVGLMMPDMMNRKIGNVSIARFLSLVMSNISKRKGTLLCILLTS
ncbi:hypothetical protein, partial [Marinomonas hwangdonensis]|uniref:hypothetical protein n=1 Tax=Marinomonas hwangdonensis TaxID=1053647 RepID=UPI0019D433BE